MVKKELGEIRKGARGRGKVSLQPEARDSRAESTSLGPRLEVFKGRPEGDMSHVLKTDSGR